MVRKAMKYVVAPMVVVLLAGGLLFGSDLFSYINSSARSIRTSVKESIPTEFELQRARDMLEQIVPEMHANIRLIAQEEVEVENLKRDIARCEASLSDERARIEKIGGMLSGPAKVFTISTRRYTREVLKADLARRFESYKEAEMVFQGKQKLLASRERSLAAAVVALQRARRQKDILADKIESLAAQHRLVAAASVGSKFQLESSKLAQTEKLIGDIKKRLDVAERVLAHEGSFVQPVEVDVIDEVDLLEQVSDYFHPQPADAVRVEADDAEADADGTVAAAAPKELGRSWDDYNE